MDRVLNAWIRELFGVVIWVDESVLRWFGHIERMENDRSAKIVYMGECVGIHLVGQSRKRWIYFVNDWVKKKV